MFNLKELFASARAAQPVRAHTPPGFVDPTRYERTSTIRSTNFSLFEPSPNLSAYFDESGRLRRTPVGRASVENVSVDPLVVARANSRLAAAGALLLLRPAPMKPHAIGAGPELPVFRREVSGLTLIEPLKMAIVPDGDDAPTGVALPIKSASVDWADEDSTPSYGVNLTIPRDDYRDRVHDGTLDEILSAAILAGAGRIADQALMAALTAASLGTFSLAAVAAKGLAFGDLRAIAGTGAAGASVGQDGVLRVAGVPAELTDTGSGTFVGAFGAAGVLLDHEFRVVADRSSPNGELSVTVYGTAAALLPDPSLLWKVAA